MAERDARGALPALPPLPDIEAAYNLLRDRWSTMDRDRRNRAISALGEAGHMATRVRVIALEPEIREAQRREREGA